MQPPALRRADRPAIWPFIVKNIESDPWTGRAGCSNRRLIRQTQILAEPNNRRSGQFPPLGLAAGAGAGVTATGVVPAAGLSDEGFAAAAGTDCLVTWMLRCR